MLKQRWIRIDKNVKLKELKDIYKSNKPIKSNYSKLKAGRSDKIIKFNCLSIVRNCFTQLMLFTKLVLSLLEFNNFSADIFSKNAF